MFDFPSIKALTRDISDKIAAGEVVERPLSIVKELTENSIDAGASSVTVEIQKGGKEYIRVTDDGHGIPKDQVRLAFKRYATSKIQTADDLCKIGTLGFRGEALPSIAAVSEMELVTKTADTSAGTKIVMKGGEEISFSDAACEDGTTIIVRDLFYNTPARKKFMRPDSTESSLIADYLTKMALAYPSVKFRFINNQSILFSTIGNGSLKQAILTLYGAKTAGGLLPISENGNAKLNLKGFVSVPSAALPNKRQQIFFVNGRWVKSKVMEDAVQAAYSDKLFEGRHPAAFLFLEIDPELVDVNVHPSKTEIKFYDENEVKDYIVKQIRLDLRQKDAAPTPLKKTDETTKDVILPDIPVHESKYGRPEAESAEKFTAQEEKSQYFDRKVLSSTENFFKELRAAETLIQTQQVIEFPKEDRADTSPETSIERPFLFSELSVISVVFNTYIIAKDEKSVYFIDQHAAHERVMFEKLLKDFNSKEKSSQVLLTPIIISLTPAQTALTDGWGMILEALGYEFEDFGPSQIAVKSIPAELSMEEAEAFSRSVIESDSRRAEDFQLRKDAIISASCKAAVKAGDRLHSIEIERLFRLLDQCENPYSCPHGRPTFLNFSESDIEKFFKRK